MQTSLLVLALLFALSFVALLVGIVWSKIKKGNIGVGKIFFGALNAIIFLVLVFYLHQQSIALDKLHGIGIRTPDELGHVVGLANGSGPKPFWMFDYEGDVSELVEFYQTASNRPGWTLVQIKQGRILLRQDPVDLKIWLDPGTVAFLLTESK